MSVKAHVNSIGRDIQRQILRTGFNISSNVMPVGKRFRELEKSQWMSADALRAYQWSRLQKLVKYAYDNVSFYRQRLDEAGVHPDHIDSPGAYARIPVLSKNDLREHKEDLVSADFPRNKLIATASGGSTGVPVYLYHDAQTIYGSKAAKLRNFKWAGWEPGGAWARLWGSNLDVSAHMKLKGQISERLTRVRWLSCFDMNEEIMARYAHILADFGPDVLEAYVNPLYLFARYLRANDLEGTIRPKGIIVSAETLYDYQRVELESVFGCKVFNRYGCREVGDIAHECEHGSLHLNAETIFTEIMVGDRPAHPGETGDIVVTPLDLYGMPMLRYRIEDLGVPAEGSCDCGRGLPIISSVQGRVQEFIVTRSEHYLSGLFFAHLLKDFDVCQFRVEQEDLNGIDVYLVPGTTLDHAALDRIRTKIREYSGGELEIRFHTVDKLSVTASGKHRPIVSKIRTDLTGTRNGEVISAR